LKNIIWIVLAYALLTALPLAAAPIAGRPNIVLITVDSFRPGRLGCYGYSRARTPVIDSLAARGVLFERAYSSASWTNPSLVSLLTGLYPPVHGVERRDRSIPPGLVTSLESLRAAGYLVPEINYLFPMPNYTNLGFTRHECRDLAQFLALERDTTFFAWYHYHGPHLPYNPPEKYRKIYLPGLKKGGRPVEAVRSNVLLPRGERAFSPRDREIVRALYDAEVAAQDEELAAVFKALDSLDLRRNTIVVLAADHGEELFEHGWVGHASTSLDGTLFEELIRIPLIISWPGHIPEGKRVASPVQGVDLMPTLFELIGLAPQGPMQGISFRALWEEKPSGTAAPLPRLAVFCECSVCGYQCPDSVEPDWLRAVQSGGWKLIQRVSPGRDAQYWLYNLMIDPGEKQDLAGRNPEELLRLQGFLSAHLLESARLRETVLAEPDSAGISGPDPFAGQAPPVAIFPAEGQTVSWELHQGAVPVRWSGPEADYVLEYSVGQGKYHLEGSFPVRGGGQTFGPFNRVFWRSFPLYNPWSFRVVPKGHPELAGPWRTFYFE